MNAALHIRWLSDVSFPDHCSYRLDRVLFKLALRALRRRHPEVAALVKQVLADLRTARKGNWSNRNGR